MIILEELVDVRILVDPRLPEGGKGGHCFSCIHPLASDQPTGNHVTCIKAHSILRYSPRSVGEDAMDECLCVQAYASL